MGETNTGLQKTGLQKTGLLKNIGPGAIVTAAFIGPGTVTACIIAGANFGYTLLWVLVFATITTIILQEMAVRLGVTTGKGLGENLRLTFETSIFKWPVFILIVTALYLGNAAYEGGNLSGAALGIQAIAGEDPLVFRVAVISLFTTGAVCLWFGSYRQLEKLLIGLIVMMAMAFIISFLLVRPDLSALIDGITRPSIPEGSLLTVIALIGTTVVPYNLFLHATAAKNRWSGPENLSTARTDTVISISLGGLIMIAITGAAAASVFGTGLAISTAGDLATQLEPLFGTSAKLMLGLGLFAAGMTSTITAPLATAYAICEIFKFDSKVTSTKFRFITLSVLVAGAFLALTGIKPITIIMFAQFANGLLLPFVAIFLLIAMNRSSVLGKYSNGIIANGFGAIVILITAGLGLRLILRTLGYM
jgi:manganese transport protein